MGVDVGWKRRGREAEEGMVLDASCNPLWEWGGSQYPDWDEVTAGWIVEVGWVCQLRTLPGVRSYVCCGAGH